MAPASLTLVIPTLNAEAGLALLLPELARHLPEAALLIADGGSTDATAALAGQSGASVITTATGRGTQLRAAIAACKTPWLLVLHADSRIGADLPAAIEAHIRKYPEQAGYGHLRFDSRHPAAAFIACMANLRARLFGLPYGDQGLLISRSLYEQAGGYPDWPLMEDVALVRKLGRRRLRPLAATVTTSASRYERDGYLPRSLRNLGCLLAYFRGVPVAEIARRYAAGGKA